MGMQRFVQSRFPEQYPAIIDERADPVEGDTAEMALLRPFLKNTNLETGLRLMYHANTDGWDPVKFHANVRVEELFMSLLGQVFNLVDTILKRWVGYGEAHGCIAAFLFVLGGKIYYCTCTCEEELCILLSRTGEKILQLVLNVDFSLVQM
jgi:hypothetical protein